MSILESSSYFFPILWGRNQQFRKKKVGAYVVLLPFSKLFEKYFLVHFCFRLPFAPKSFPTENACLVDFLFFVLIHLEIAVSTSVGRLQFWLENWSKPHLSDISILIFEISLMSKINPESISTNKTRVLDRAPKICSEKGRTLHSHWLLKNRPFSSEENQIVRKI